MGRRRVRFGFPRRRSQWALIAVILLIAQRLIPRGPDGTKDFGFDSAGTYRVVRVVDGDTLLLDGNVRVRLIGVDTPETKHPHRPVDPLGLEAEAFTKSQVEGRDVTLQFDRERKDRYDRVLAYVFRGDWMLNEELIRAGYTRAETRFPFDRGMAARFRRAENEARQASRGMWRRPLVSGRSADDAAAPAAQSNR